MPILHASYKDIKKSAKKALRNQSVKSNLKTEVKKFLDLISSKKTEEAKKQLNHLISQLDKAKSKGIIHKNTASRKISRLMKKIKTA
jgi:small subunit ribosomal protein S20